MTAYQLAPVNARGGMFEQLCDELPWSQRLVEVWRMRDPEERDASLALRAGTATGCAKRSAGTAPTAGCTPATRSRWPPTRSTPTSNDRAAGKDCAADCATPGRWPTRSTGACTTLATTSGPTVTAARDQVIGVGDLIISRNNDATIAVQPGARHRGGRIDQVRNGNRWRVAGVDPDDQSHRRRTHSPTRPASCSRATICASTSPWATPPRCTPRKASPPTRCHAILGEAATRAMAYVAMTRGRDNNHAYIYNDWTARTDHEHTAPVDNAQIHQLRRGNKYSAAHYFRTILANDDRPRTMHAEAERTERHLLPDIVADVLARHEQRRAARRAAWREHAATARTRQAAYERICTGAGRSLDLDANGLDL